MSRHIGVDMGHKDGDRTALTLHEGGAWTLVAELEPGAKFTLCTEGPCLALVAPKDGEPYAITMDGKKVMLGRHLALGDLIALGRAGLAPLVTIRG